MPSGRCTIEVRLKDMHRNPSTASKSHEKVDENPLDALQRSIQDAMQTLNLFSGEAYEQNDLLLHRAYARSLELAKEKEVKTLGCSLLRLDVVVCCLGFLRSAGIFRGDRPLYDVLAIACQASGEKDFQYLSMIFSGFGQAVKENVYEGKNRLKSSQSHCLLC